MEMSEEDFSTRLENQEGRVDVKFFLDSDALHEVSRGCHTSHHRLQTAELYSLAVQKAGKI